MQILELPVNEIHFDPANARKHPDRNLDAIKASLLRFGQQTPIVIDGKNVVRKGNGTLAAAKSLGWSTIKVIQSDLHNVDLAAYAIADNRTSELAEWDGLVLAETLEAIRSEEDGDELLAASGFTEDELEGLLKGLGDDAIDNGDLANAIGGLPDGDKSPFQQMTFTVTDAQTAKIKAALDAAKDVGEFIDTGNENSNGNALERIAEAYL